MSNEFRLKIIIEKRSDAIAIYNEALISFLKNKQDVTFVILDNRQFSNRYLNFVVEIINAIKLAIGTRKNDTLLFTDPLGIHLMVATLLLRNKKYSLFFHYEQDPFYYKFIPRITYSKVLRKLDGIICSSNFSQKQLVSLGVNISKSLVIYCGVNHELFKHAQSQKYDFRYILSIGSEEPRKNMDNILRAFKIVQQDIPDIKLLKVGVASTKNRSDTMQCIEKLELQDSVIFEDHVSIHHLAEIYSNAQLLLFPSLMEGFGLPIIEAMACGCPVVTSNRPPMTELIGSGQVATDPLNPDEIAQACKKILLDQEYQDAVVRDGIARAEYFNWKKTAESVYSFITSSQ